MLREVARWGAIGTIAGLATACLPGVAAAADRPARIVETPAVTGTPQVGSPLQASGRWRGGEPVTVTWAWQRCSGYTLDSCAEIPGANGTTYVPVDADAGSMLRV